MVVGDGGKGMSALFSGLCLVFLGHFKIFDCIGLCVVFEPSELWVS